LRNIFLLTNSELPVFPLALSSSSLPIQTKYRQH
jgi:hypothetical protein